MMRRPYMSTAFATPTARIAATIQARKPVPRCSSIPSIATEVSATMPIAAACDSTASTIDTTSDHRYGPRKRRSRPNVCR
jgi:hypothetical protein